MIHVFSLIHDDLPAMDNDNLRRGQPTNHKVYGDAVAILTGDGLLAQAFLPLTTLDLTQFAAQNVLSLIRLIAESTGTPGMIGGQVMDVESEGKSISLDRLKTLHRMKTGALLKAAVVGPAILSGADAKIKTALENYGDAIGLAFQIADDILDIEGGVEIGKDVGSDVARGKSTYPALMGMDGAKRELICTLETALEALSIFDHRAEPLRAIARYIVERKK
jgi:geranylgeranyl diphosphate synthase type II